MKIQCDVCEKAEAEVLCCADEAVLCRTCDDKVHAANKLSQKHQRVFLLKHSTASSSSPSSSSSSPLPLCDICQERNGYFFCLEDRALLCRQCDASIHMETPYLSSHQRFLIAGIKVALQPSSNNTQHCSADNNSAPEMIVDAKATATSAETAFAQEPIWPLDEILGTNDFDYYEFSDMGSSRISSQ